MDKKGTYPNLALDVNYTMVNVLIVNVSIVNGYYIHHQQVPTFALFTHYSQVHSLIFPKLNLWTKKILQNIYLDMKMILNVTKITHYSRQKESGQLDSVFLELYFKNSSTVNNYWQKVLKRIVTVVEFLSSR